MADVLDGACQNRSELPVVNTADFAISIVDHHFRNHGKHFFGYESDLLARDIVLRFVIERHGTQAQYLIKSVRKCSYVLFVSFGGERTSGTGGNLVGTCVLT